MPRFFADNADISADIITLRGENAHHISHSLRMAVGEHVTVCDMESNEYDCIIKEFSGDFVKLSVLSKTKSTTEPPFFAHLYQALPKGDKLDTVIQKAVECGVYDITPFESAFCIAKVKADAEDKKTQRRVKIAEAAAKQCGRGILPAVYPTVSFDAMLSLASECDLIIFCYEGDGVVPLGKILKERLPKFESAPHIAVIVGSEGGFSEDEVQRAKDKGACLAGLGSRILRTETAATFVLSCLVLETELS